MNSKKYILRSTQPWPIFMVVLFVSVVFRIWLIWKPALVWWDSAIYIGIGKYIFTGGKLGVFEIFRPFLWPLIQGSLWKLGLDPNLFGKIIVALFSIALLGLVYKIGESMKKYAGVTAAGLIATAPVFLAFSVMPITDITSATLSLLALWLTLKKRWFFAGAAVSLAFAFRIPHALMVLPILGFLILQAFQTKQWSYFLKAFVMFIIGSLLIIGPYFIVAQVRYGNAFLPIAEGTRVISTTNEPSSYDYLYYLKELIRGQWLFIFGYLTMLALPFSRRFGFPKGVILSAFAFIVFCGYFSHVLHKEFRYSLAFMSYLSLITGYAVTFALEKISLKSVRGMIVVLILFSLVHPTYNFYKTNLGTNPSLASYSAFEHFFDGYPNARVVTSYPMIVAVSDVKIDEIIDTWENALDAYTRRKNSTDFVMLDSCLMNCGENRSTCEYTKNTVLGTLNQKEELVFLRNTPGQCELSIYKLNRN